MANLSLEHKWTVHNFDSFYDVGQNVDSKFESSQSTSQFIQETNDLSSSLVTYTQARKNAGKHRFIFSNNLVTSEHNDWGDIHLELCPYGVDSDSKDYVSIFINLRTFKDGDFNVSCEITIRDQNEKEITKMHTRKLEKSTRFSWDQFILRNDLKNSENKIIKDLIIECKVKIYTEEILNDQADLQISESEFLTHKQKVLKSFAHHWTIDNFIKYFETSDKQAITREFSNSKGDSTQFQLRLLPQKETNILVVELIPKSPEDKSNELAHFRLSLKHSRNSAGKYFSIGAPFEIKKSNSNNSIKWNIIIDDYLLNLLKQSNLPDKQTKLIIQSEVWIIEVPQISQQLNISDNTLLKLLNSESRENNHNSDAGLNQSTSSNNSLSKVSTEVPNKSVKSQLQELPDSTFIKLLNSKSKQKDDSCLDQTPSNNFSSEESDNTINNLIESTIKVFSSLDISNSAHANNIPIENLSSFNKIVTNELPNKSVKSQPQELSDSAFIKLLYSEPKQKGDSGIEFGQNSPKYSSSTEPPNTISDLAILPVLGLGDMRHCDALNPQFPYEVPKIIMDNSFESTNSAISSLNITNSNNANSFDQSPMTNLSFSHKWIIHNFNSFYNRNKSADCKFVSSLNTSEFNNERQDISNDFFYNESRKNSGNYRFIFSSNLIPMEQNDWGDIHFELCPFGFDSRSKDYVSLFINQHLFRDLNAIYKVSIFDQDGNEIISKGHDGNLKKFFRLSWDKLIKQSNLKNYEYLEIRCEVTLSVEEISRELSSDQTKLNTSESHFYTEEKVLKAFSHQWTINNFNQLFQNSIKQFESEEFSISLIDPTQFQLRLWPKKELNILSVGFITKSQEDKLNETVYFRVSLLDSSNASKPFSSGAKMEIKISDSNNGSTAWNMIIEDELLKQNKFIIYCEVWIIEVSDSSQISQLQNSQNNTLSVQDQSNLSLHLEQNFESIQHDEFVANGSTEIFSNTESDNAKSIVSQEIDDCEECMTNQCIEDAKSNFLVGNELREVEMKFETTDTQFFIYPEIINQINVESILLSTPIETNNSLVMEKSSNRNNFEQDKIITEASEITEDKVTRNDSTNLEVKSERLTKSLTLPIDNSGQLPAQSEISDLTNNKSQSNNISNNMFKQNQPCTSSKSYAQSIVLNENSTQQIKCEIEDKSSEKTHITNIFSGEYRNVMFNVASTSTAGDINFTQSTSEITEAKNEPQIDDRVSKKRHISCGFTWTIPKFSAISILGDQVDSEDYSYPSAKNPKFIFELQYFPKGFNNDGDEVSFRILLKKCNLNTNEIGIQANLSIINLKKDKINPKNKVFIGKLSEGKYGNLEDYCTVEYIQDDKNAILLSDKLTLDCIIDVFNVCV